MATSVTTSLPLWLAGCTYDGDAGNDLRNSMVTAMFYDHGIVTGSSIGVLGGVIGGAGLIVSAASGMSVTVQPGSFVVPVTVNPVAGGYVSTLATQATLTVATADPSNPRIDIVAAYVDDTGTSASSGAVEIITGTAAPSPSAPAAPANSIILAQISVPAAAASVSQGMITDMRPFTTATGGILVAGKGAVRGYVGQLAYDPASQSFYHNSNFAVPSGGPLQMRTLPWAPQTAVLTTSTNVSGGTTSTLASVTVTTDGSTDIECIYKWSGIEQAAQTSSQLEIQLLIDGTQADGVYVASGLAAGLSNQGGAVTYRTSSVQGTTPAAGTHTVTMQAVNSSGGGNTITVVAAAARPVYLYVKPVSL
jgi:hypothetical protein